MKFEKNFVLIKKDNTAVGAWDLRLWRAFTNIYIAMWMLIALGLRCGTERQTLN